MDSVLSVSNKNFTGNKKKLAEISRAIRKTKDHLQSQFFGICKILRKFILESSDVNTSSIRDERHCWTSSTKSKRRNISYIATVRIGWEMVVQFYGMLLLSAERPRLLWRRENSYERRFGELFKVSQSHLEHWFNIIQSQHVIKSEFISFPDNGWISSDFRKRSSKTSSFGEKVLRFSWEQNEKNDIRPSVSWFDCVLDELRIHYLSWVMILTSSNVD